MSEKLLKISVNENLINKYKPEDPQHFAHGFMPNEVTISQLEKLVGWGYCFSYQFKNNHRKTENFLCSDFLAVDIDGGRTIKECLNDPIVKEFGSLFYTTPRHSPDHHRFRLVFTLPRTIRNVNELKCAALALSRRLGGDLSATDGARMFYGSEGCYSELLGKTITEDFLNELIVDGNDNPKSDSISNRWKTTNISKKQIDPNQPIKTTTGATVRLKDIKTKTSVFCPFHPDEIPQAKVTISKASRSRYLVCKKCDLLWWEKNSRFAKFDFNGFEKIVKRIKNGDIKKDESELTPLEIYADLGGIPAKNIHITNDEFIQPGKIRDGLTIIKSPKGTGKTTYLASELKGIIENFQSFEEFEEAAFDDPDVKMYSDDRILLIGHRQALIGDLCKRLHLNSYLDDSKYSKHEITHRRSRYGLCLDSLWKVEHEKYDVIVIDEVEQVLGHFLSETIGPRRERIFQIFSILLKKATKIVVLDADISWISFNTLHSLITDVENDVPAEKSNQKKKAKALPIHIHINDWKLKSRDIKMFLSDLQLIEHIKGSVLDGKRIFITSNSKKKIKVLAKAISNLSKDADMDIPLIAITSENSGSKDIQKFIKNIKKEILDYKVILSSPSLGTGIDITFDNKRQEIDIVYGLFESRINSHFEIDQQLARVRHPKAVNVWVSSARFSFATDIAVVTEDCLRSDIINSVAGGFVYNSEFDQWGVSPFLKMAAMIVATHRSSKNDLKTNFINYKRLQNWNATEVEKDSALWHKGKAFYAPMRGLTEFEEAENISNATTLNEYQYKKFRKRIEQFEESAEPQEWYRFFKTQFELFYGVPATTDFVVFERKKNYRKKVRRFESIQREPGLTDEEKANLVSKKARRLAKTKLEVLVDYHAGSSLLYKLLSTTPIFTDGEFDQSVVISTHDLKEFAERSAEFRKFVATQLDVSTRTDVATKPIQHLGDLLELVGLKLEKCATKKSGGPKTYYYKLSTSKFDRMLRVTKQRAVYDSELKSTGWPYVNKLHGFQYLDEEMDWLLQQG